jgi:hypothetical protein
MRALLPSLIVAVAAAYTVRSNGTALALAAVAALLGALLSYLLTIARQSLPDGESLGQRVSLRTAAPGMTWAALAGATIAAAVAALA